MAKKEIKKEIKDSVPILTPEQIELRHKQEFLQAYNNLVEVYGYSLIPVLRLELVKVNKPKVENKIEKK